MTFNAWVPWKAVDVNFRIRLLNNDISDYISYKTTNGHDLSEQITNVYMLVDLRYNAWFGIVVIRHLLWSVM